MYISVETEQCTGLEFIDTYHRIIETLVNELCEEITVSRDLENIMLKIDELIEEIMSYLHSKQECRDKYACQGKSAAEEILQNLRKFQQTMKQFGNTLPSSIAINEIHLWAKSSVFEPDQKCISCCHIPAAI